MDVHFEQIGHAGVINLDRCDALNAVSKQMVDLICDQLRLWEQDEAVHYVIIRSLCERAFSSGGDLREIYDNRENPECSMAFFKAEYQLNAYIKRYSKPYIALIDGIVMGGGVGISLHGSHVVMGEKVVFAMPEVSIGFFPDIGGSYFLSRLNHDERGALGLYLGLSGARLGQGDCYFAGLSSHCCPSNQMQTLYEALIKGNRDGLEETLKKFHQPPSDVTLSEHMDKINRLFSAPSLSKMMASLAKDDSEWAKKLYERFLKFSPTSLAVSFEQIRRGKKLTMAQAMAMEYGITEKMLKGNDFYEGVYRILFDKTYLPKWQPKTINEVDWVEISAYFENSVQAIEFERLPQ